MPKSGEQMPDLEWCIKYWERDKPTQLKLPADQQESVSSGRLSSFMPRSVYSEGMFKLVCQVNLCDIVKFIV